MLVWWMGFGFIVAVNKLSFLERSIGVINEEDQAIYSIRTVSASLQYKCLGVLLTVR